MRGLGLALVAGVLAFVLWRRWLDVVEVQGSSMAPTLRHGEWLVVERRTLSRRPPRAGEIVLAPDPRNRPRELIKRVASVDRLAGTAELRGDASETSTDSRSFGAVPIATVRWRALARYRPISRLGWLS
jgi:nickel-type superoxide dismutase maturation protease